MRVNKTTGGASDSAEERLTRKEKGRRKRQREEKRRRRRKGGRPKKRIREKIAIRREEKRKRKRKGKGIEERDSVAVPRTHPIGLSFVTGHCPLLRARLHYLSNPSPARSFPERIVWTPPTVPFPLNTTQYNTT